MLGMELTLKKLSSRVAGWLAELVEHAILDLGVASSSPTFGIEITLKIF